MLGDQARVRSPFFLRAKPPIRRIPVPNKAIVEGSGVAEREGDGMAESKESVTNPFDWEFPPFFETSFVDRARSMKDVPPLPPPAVKL